MFSLADPPDFSPLSTAVQWLEAVLLGQIATSIALIAIAGVGIAMLGGRVPLRKGATVLLGCFILFGASTIAKGILGAVALTSVREAQPFPPVVAQLSSPLSGDYREPSKSHDPYAGASVPQR